MRVLYACAGDADRYLTRAIQELGHLVQVEAALEDGLAVAALGGWQVMVYDEAAPSAALARRFAAACPDASLLVFARRDEAAARIAVLRAGADAWFARPYQFTEVNAKLEALMRRRAPGLEAFELAPAERGVRLGGELVRLSRRDYALLALLAGRPGQVTPMDAILEAVWGEEAEPRPELVRKSVSRLRAALERGRGWRLLHAVRGHGYCFRIERSA